MANILPRIITDEENNVNLVNMKFQMTLEKYHDLLHHTHNFSDLVGSDEAISSLASDISEINKNIATINENIIKILEYIDQDITAIIEED